MKKTTLKAFQRALLIISFLVSATSFAQNSVRNCVAMSTDFNCGTGEELPYNFYWQGGTPNGAFFDSMVNANLQFEEFDDGTARITGLSLIHI